MHHRALLSTLILTCLAIPSWGQPYDDDYIFLLEGLSEVEDSLPRGAEAEMALGWRALAIRYFDEGRWSDAKNAFLEYLEQRPDDVNAISDLGVCYMELGDSDRALRNFDRALVLDPGHWQALYNKIIVLGFDLDKKVEAKQLMRTLRSLHPDNPDVLWLSRHIARLR